MSAPASIHALCDGTDRLVEADAPLVALQRRCGGDMPGLLAVPALLALVRKVRKIGVPLARRIATADDGKPLSVWAEAVPEGDGARITLSDWRLETPGSVMDAADPASGSEDLLRHIADAHVFLDANQRVLAAQGRCADLAGLSPGAMWTEVVRFEQVGDLAGRGAALHWRLLDDARFGVPGSERRWRARLLPRAGGAGFELLAIPEAIDTLPEVEPAVPAAVAPPPAPVAAPAWNGLLGHDLAPALRQPVSRIIANAETIRTRLAGPLADEYAGYAADIAEAGRHLLSLVEDLADLEAIEAPDFSPAPDHIDLADCARRAAGILSVRAQERGITLQVPGEGEHAPAIGEFRRVLQILLNLVTNAIRYTPGNTHVVLSCGTEGGTAWISVADQGEGLTGEQAVRVFEKFERLGRSGDGGSGLGLYISRRLARAMGGNLDVASTPGEGASFVLSLPADRAESLSSPG